MTKNQTLVTIIKMNTKNLAVVIIFTLLISPCWADELELHATSYHFDEHDDDDFNEFNIGAGYNYEFNSKTYAVIGAFNNSYDKLSVYVGAKWLPIDIKFFKAGFMAGLVTGYEDDTDANAVQPMIIPEIQFHYKQFFLASRVIPDFGENSTTAITFSIGFTLPGKSQDSFAAK